MTESTGKDIGIDRRLLQLATDSARLDALVLLNERTATVGDVAAELGISTAAAAEHLEAMLEAGMIEVADEVPRRGETASRYRALVRAIWNDTEWSTLSLEDRQRLSAWIVQLINSDVAEAMAAGTFESQPDSHTSRMVSLVDEQGWHELAQIQDDALEASLAIQAESAERLSESGEEGISALSAMLCCELPRRRTV